MNKKKKKRFKQYCDLSETLFQVSPIKPVVPGDTRVGGNYDMYVSVLRARYLLVLLEIKSDPADIEVYKKYSLTNKDWIQVAEFVAVLDHVNVLCKRTQADNVSELATVFLEVALIKWKLSSHQATFNVVDLSKRWNTNAKLQDIPKKKFKKALLDSVTQTFIKRLIDEFDRYFTEPDLDQKIAMQLHPVYEWQGFNFLRKIAKDKNFREQKVIQISELTVRTLLDFYRETLQEKSEKGRKENNSAETTDAVDSSADDDDWFMNAMQKSEDNMKNNDDRNKTYDELVARFRSEIEAELQDFCDYCKKMKMNEVLEICGNEAYFHDKQKGTLKNTHLLNVAKDYFDVIKFWKMIGCDKWNKLNILALIVLSKPSHNAYQERVFSMGTFKDSRLQKRRLEHHFEMAVLDRVNADFIGSKIYEETLNSINKEDGNGKTLVEHFFVPTDGVADRIKKDNINKVKHAVEEYQLTAAKNSIDVDDDASSVNTDGENDEISVDASSGKRTTELHSQAVSPNLIDLAILDDDKDNNADSSSDIDDDTTSYGI